MSQHLLIAPHAPAGWNWSGWPVALPGHTIAVSGGFDADWERAAAVAARTAGMPLLSIRAARGEVLIGPLYPTSGGACAGCAQSRAPGPDADARRPTAFGLRAFVADYLAVLAANGLAPGDLVAISADGTVRRHRVRRVADCVVCRPAPVRTVVASPPPAPVPDAMPDTVTVPARRVLVNRPTRARVPTRGEPPFGLDPARMRREVTGPRYGPVTRVRRKGRAPFAMTEVNLQGAQYAGFGRGRTYRVADAIAFLEAYERFANVPREAAVIGNVTRRDLGDHAIDPTGLGHYTPRQLAASSCRLRSYHDDVPLDWVWGHRLSDGAPLLVPAEVGFYRYVYPPDPTTGAPRRACFDESSSGSALGATFEEATLHSLIELAERDAFLHAWHRAAPLPCIDQASLTDRETRMLIDVVEANGYDLHLLVATVDLAIPVVWALALRREQRFPAAFHTAGASPDPVDAVRSALWELGQLVTVGQDLDADAADAVGSDPWRIVALEDHVRYNALPRHAARADRVLGGPRVSLAEAFPGWPAVFVDAARSDVTGALTYVADRYAAAGLDTIVVVDQSGTEHRDAGLTAVKAVVPGIVPMCFGHAHQRLAGLARLAPVLAGAGETHAAAGISFDPHPFP